MKNVRIKRKSVNLSASSAARDESDGSFEGAWLPLCSMTNKLLTHQKKDWAAIVRQCYGWRCDNVENLSLGD